MAYDLEKTIKKASDILYMHLEGVKQKHADMLEAAEWVLNFMRIDKEDPYYDTILL